MSDHQKLYVALMASAFLHALMGLLIVVWTFVHPMGLEKPLPDLKQIEMTLMAAPAPTPLEIAALATPPPAPPPSPPKVTRSTLDTDGLETTEKPPDKAAMESDINSRAASELPATGTAPLPSQEGKQRTFTNFKTQDFSLGHGAQPAPPAKPDAAPSEVPPMVTPEPEKSALDEMRALEKPTPLFTPTPAPTATPHDAIALGKPTPVPTPEPVRVAASASPAPQVAKLVPAPALRAHTEAPRTTPREPGYQPQREQTKIEGGISNKGKAGADVIATPLGRYKKTIADAIGSRWYFYINGRMDLITVGDVHIKFYVNQQGRPEEVKILSNTANDTFGNYCIQSVSEAKIPPLPPDVAPALVGGRLEIDYHFTIYPQ